MIAEKKIIALVPIKNHSERVPNKSFKDFCGMPLYHHILHTLEKTCSVDKVIINTDSDLIKTEANRIFKKVKVFDRPDYLLGDFTSVNKIIEYDISNSDGDIFIQTHVTNPLLKSSTIEGALGEFIDLDGECDSIFSVNKFQNRFYHHTGKAINHNPDELIRTQDLEPIYEENSNFYIFTKESFLYNNSRIGNSALMYEIPQIEAIDIDEPDDFYLAEIIQKARGK